MITIWIDADAAPRDVLDTARHLGNHYSAMVKTVSSINHAIQGEHHIQVDASPQATDMRIINEISNKEPAIVVTQDYGLAALALFKGARAVSAKGVEYTAQNMDRLLFERALHQHERKATGRNKGPKARTKQDKQAFAMSLERILHDLAHQVDQDN